MRFPTGTSRASNRSGSGLRWVVASIAAAVVVLVAIAISLWQYREEVEARALLTGRAIEAGVEAQLRRQFERYDAALQLVIANYSDPTLRMLDDSIWRLLLSNIQDSVTGIRSITIANAGGRVIAQQGDSLGDDLSGLPFFQSHQSIAGLGLMISQPSDGSGKSPTMVLSRRIVRSDGRFGGVVAMVVDLSSIRNILWTLPLGPLDSVTVVSEGGRIVVRRPSVALTGDAGLDLSRSPAFRQMREMGHGDFVMRSSLDGVERLFTFSDVTGTKLLVSVGLATTTLYADWWFRSELIGGLALAVSFAFVLAAFLLSREIKLRSTIQAKLEQQAQTDFLTGLANRRQFDAVLQNEWRRAARTGADLAVVLFDADHFKRLNDAFGHAAGDELLKLIAGVIDRSARRPGDLPARIGGEEFALILANTNRDGALHVAERIRRAVAEAELPSGAANAELTLSAGVAATTGSSAGSAERLLAAADAALYRAKEEGRNRVKVDGETSP